MAENQVQPENDGFSFENDEEMQMGIETKIYDNGNVVKRYTLKDGRIAIVRELTGADIQKSNRLFGKEEERAISAMMHLCVTVDSVQHPMEFFEALKGKDFGRLSYATTKLNF